MNQLATMFARAAPNRQLVPDVFAQGMAMSTLRMLVFAAGAGLLLAQPVKSAEVLLSCVLQSHGSGHEKRSFNITIDQQAQRAQIGGNYSLPATISQTQISFSVNLSGSVFQYVIDRTSGLGTIAIKDQVLYSGMCMVADSGHQAL
jgi:hypothetical protein